MQARSLEHEEKPMRKAYYDSSSHSETLLAGLDALRTGGHLLDVTLYAQGRAFQAHRAVLASCSDYFRAMFTDAMLESKQSEIRLKGVTAEGISLLLDYAYTSRLGLNLTNIQDVLSAASHIQIVAVVEACSAYLEHQLDLENCVDIATIAETYSLRELVDKVYRFISSHLKEFSLTKEFYRLSPQQMEYLLSCDFPVDFSEAEVLRIAISWLRFHTSIGQKQRMSYVNQFLRNVHLLELTQWEIESVMHKAFSGASGRDGQLYLHMLQEVKDLTSKRIRPRLDQQRIHNLVNSRGMELAIIKVGGFGVNGVTNEITYYLPSKGKWKHLTAIPHLEQSNFGTAVLNNELYVVGGCFNQGQHENVHPFGFRYSPRYNKWLTIAPMQRERCRFSFNVVGERLYAVGGASEMVGYGMDVEVGEELDHVGTSEAIAAVERYNPANDTWESRRPLSTPRSQHAGCAWPPMYPDRLIISGGLDLDVVLSTMSCYHTKTDTWQRLKCMLTPRADHTMLAIGDKLYVCGGWFEDSGTGARLLASTIDAYDIEDDSWRVVTTVPTPRFHAGIVSFGNKIYLISGFHSDVMFDKATASIEYYDVELDVWGKEKDYPQEVWEHTCVNLFIPKCRDDVDVLPAVKDRSYILRM